MDRWTTKYLREGGWGVDVVKPLSENVAGTIELKATKPRIVCGFFS